MDAKLTDKTSLISLTEVYKDLEKVTVQWFISQAQLPSGRFRKISV